MLDGLETILDLGECFGVGLHVSNCLVKHFNKVLKPLVNHHYLELLTLLSVAQALGLVAV
jgi:hypothetical protein